MSGMTDYLAGKLLDHIFRSITYTPPDTIYLALYTTAPGAAGGGVEVVGGSYARQPIPFGPPQIALRKISSNATSLFTNMPAVTIAGAAFVDAVTDGNILWTKDGLTRVVAAGENLFLGAADLNAFLN